MYFVYMVKDSRDNLYIGITADIIRRLSEHNSGRGATFTKQGEFELVFSESHDNLQSARAREIQIKKWRRDKKESLIERYQKRLPTKS